MKIQKLTDRKLAVREIAENDLAYFQFKGWTLAADSSAEQNSPAGENSDSRKKKHRFEDEV